MHLAEPRHGARVVAGARVTRVLIENGAAVGVEADLGHPGAARTLDGPCAVVVLAAGALRTPAILLRSGLEHPAIGRHLRLHPVPVMAGRFHEEIEMWRGTMQAARSLEFADTEGPQRLHHRIAPGTRACSPSRCRGRAGRTRPGHGRSVHIAPLIAVTRDGGAGRVS